MAAALPTAVVPERPGAPEPPAPHGHGNATRPFPASVMNMIHRRGPWRSFEAVEYATRGWVDWFNNQRLLGPIGNIPPAEAEANHYAASENLNMAA